MYRFALRDPAWLPTSTAYLFSGCYLTITQAERDPTGRSLPLP